MKLSIIVPMFNVEKYIEKCLTSCVKQNIDPSDYEVIVINDGSLDNSLEKAKTFEKEFSQIRVYDKPNGGLSSARNEGLQHAKGDYIWFVDSDDWIEENCLGSILKDCYDNYLDGIIIQGIRVVDGIEKRGVAVFSSDKIESGIDKMKDHDVNCAAVKTIIKRSYFSYNGFRFYEGIYHEDQEFTPRIYYSLKRVMESNYFVYYNRLTANSITQSINPKKGFDLIVVANNIYHFMESISLGDRQPYYNFISSDLNQSFSNIINAPNEIKQQFLNLIEDKGYLFSCFLKSNLIKYKLEGVLIRILPFNVLTIYKFIKR